MQGKRPLPRAPTSPPNWSIPPPPPTRLWIFNVKLKFPTQTEFKPIVFVNKPATQPPSPVSSPSETKIADESLASEHTFPSYPDTYVRNAFIFVYSAEL